MSFIKRMVNIELTDEYLAEEDRREAQMLGLMCDGNTDRSSKLLCSHCEWKDECSESPFFPDDSPPISGNW